MNVILVKFLTILSLLQHIKTELYADYADYDDNNGNFVGNDQRHDHSKDDFYQVDHFPVTDGVANQLNGELSEHTMVTNSNVFPYMVTILMGSKYISSGALIDANWVLTTADGLYLLGDSLRFLRVRLGSINYKKGGIVRPIKLLEIHPYFDDKRPNFDLALLMLAQPIRYTPNMRAIRLQMVPRDVSATHFIVTSWPGPLLKSENTSLLQSMEIIKRHRILTVTHLHPSDPEECTEALKTIGSTNETIMCLDPALKDPCLRDVGAPVVLNRVLWAVVSSWKPDDCESGAGGPMFANLVSAKNISTWIHAIVHGHAWTPHTSEKPFNSTTISTDNFDPRKTHIEDGP